LSQWGFKKSEIVREKPINPAFVKKIEESRKQVKEVKTRQIKKENLKEFLGLYHSLQFGLYRPQGRRYYCPTRRNCRDKCEKANMDFIMFSRLCEVMNGMY